MEDAEAMARLRPQETIPLDVDGPSTNAERVGRGELPARYGDPWVGQFLDLARPAMKTGMAILDVGSGRRPTIPAAWRPTGTHYTGLDISAHELAVADSDAYDEVIVGDVSSRVVDLVGRFDLIVSWQVLEHVDDLQTSLDNMKSYLRPGGRMIALLSGSYAAFAMIARVTPYWLRAKAMERLLHQDPDTKFPTRYDKCHDRALNHALGNWGSYEVLPQYRGGVYFSFFRPLERLYLVYENWICRTGRRNLATHYLIVGDL
jgi:SAM-dependent methyltransferase